MMERDEKFLRGLPDRDAARRFLTHLEAASPSAFARLNKNDGLLSDVLTLVSFSPLLATTLLQNPEYLSWLDRTRREQGVTSKDDLLESLARYALTNSTVEAQVIFARFRRRELLRIYLRDIRRILTIAEVTEEISNLADATLEYALRLARNEMDSRFGQPQESGETGRPVIAKFCVAALGKLGSRELNYSSDIDLLFLYSSEGTTAGGSRGSVTNREYFVKLAEHLTKLIGQPSGEGAAYRVDLRLRPHGTLGPLAQTVDDLVRYYENEARPWERQVMIRSRGCAGDIELFRQLFGRIEHLVFSTDQSVDGALANVRGSKLRIDAEQSGRSGFDVKLGRGGVREIEFIAQALQLAYGGRDEWLRAPHTLISLDRLRDRRHINDAELSELASAYDFLRSTEHILQMENGVQTHAVPEDAGRRKLVADRVRFATDADLEKMLPKHTEAVHRIFERIFGGSDDTSVTTSSAIEVEPRTEKIAEPSSSAVLKTLSKVSPHFSSMVAANPGLSAHLARSRSIDEKYRENLLAAVDRCSSFRERLAALRQTWSRSLLDIVIADVSQTIELSEVKRLQTALAETSIDTAIEIAKIELGDRYKTEIDDLALAVLALGKLGGKGVDYDSDLDLVLVYDADAKVPDGTTRTEFFSRAAELFVTTLSSMTRDGHLYRVDLRLRPYGSKGLSAMSSDAFLEYMRDTAAPWEMLAFVKLRAVGGDLKLATAIEKETRSIIHRRAFAMDADELRTETRAVRQALEDQRARAKRSGEIDIKYGAGGLLDVYFATRYLQLRHDVPDDEVNRSTLSTLELLHKAGVLGDETRNVLAGGYEFLSNLDHNVRLTIGRTTRVPFGNEAVMRTIAERMGLKDPAAVTEDLTLQRRAIRGAFNALLESDL